MKELILHAWVISVFLTWFLLSVRLPPNHRDLPLGSCCRRLLLAVQPNASDAEEETLDGFFLVCFSAATVTQVQNPQQCMAAPEGRGRFTDAHLLAWNCENECCFHSRITCLGLLTMHIVDPDIHGKWLFMDIWLVTYSNFKHPDIDLVINECLSSSFISTHALMQDWSGVKLVSDVFRCLFLPWSSALFKIYLVSSELLKNVGPAVFQLSEEPGPVFNLSSAKTWLVFDLIVNPYMPEQWFLFYRLEHSKT